MEHPMIIAMHSLFNMEECITKEKKNPKTPQQPDYTPTEAKIAEMLTKNTGCDILDSGGAYGRNWEKNRHIQDFRQLPRFTYEIDKSGQIIGNLNIFHFLTENLEYTTKSDRLTKAMYKWTNKKLPDAYWPEIVEEFIKAMHWEKEYGENSYNSDSMLSQVIQYDIANDGNNNYFALLQIHGGCDIRGGYTAPVIFELPEMDEYALAGGRDLSASCKCTQMDSDDCGYYWTGSIRSFDWTKNKETLLYISKFPALWKLREKEDGKDHEYYCKRCKQVIEFRAY
jgi:hypothetical protein